MGHIKWFSKAALSVRNMKLHNKLLAGYLLAGVVPLMVVSAIIYQHWVKGLEESAQEFASLYTSQIEVSLNNFTKEYDMITKSVLVDNDIIFKFGEERKLTMDELIIQKVTVQRLLMRLAMLKPEIVNVMLISRDNGIYQYGSATSMVNMNALVTKEWYKRLQSSDNTFFITGLHDRTYYEDKGQGALVTIGRVLLNYDGTYAGLLLIDIDPYTLLPLGQDFLNVQEKYGIAVDIRDSSGEIVYHSDAASGKQSWKKIMESGKEFASGSSTDGKIVLTGQTELGNLIIKTEISRDKLLKKISKMKVVTVMVIVITCLIMMIISITLSYTITKPIKALRRSMKQAETGEYKPIHSEQSNDEIGCLVSSYNKMITTIRTLIEEVYIAEIKRRHAKFIALQNQINPHMLYNTLESIRMKAIVNEDEETADMIMILGRMFRLALGKEGRRHSIKDEVEYTVNYLKLQNIRFDDKFCLDIRIPDEMQRCNIIPIVFQPIVENSINHGYQDYNRMMNIVIEGLWTEEGWILIRISDDGLGMSVEEYEGLSRILEEAELDKYKLESEDGPKEKGLGLKNIAERIKIHYGERYHLKILPCEGQGTAIEILIPKL
ncbi:cache domain-containing sensor histidine kinase [Paenibacillus rigui]|uniref:histidine kinase n=1 Tax=Paenibacillus rigui TaxID=554312 RepID=A0A229UPS3_9BACL|nr:sensor histidine kinase [Paenibacillus rigui]OXM85486.1 two-component sensor histidine kinase [Paenibacillus rigui]